MKDYIHIAIEKGVPEHIAYSLGSYIIEGYETGGFLYAVLSNNLMESFGKADSKSILHMKEICSFLYNDTPMGCHGSEEKVLNWKGLLKEQKK